MISLILFSPIVIVCLDLLILDSGTLSLIDTTVTTRIFCPS